MPPLFTRSTAKRRLSRIYTAELQAVNVIKKSTEPPKFADRIYVDVLG